MNRSGYADLPLHYGKVPAWLANRMSQLGLLITESILEEYGKAAFVKRMSDPLWFQSLGCVLGMDWHSSGITTSVLGALKKAINPYSKSLGIRLCGGRGKHSRNTPKELINYSNETGLDGELLVKSSRLSAKVDNTVLQDGYNIYLHSFILSDQGDWSVVQQGMNDSTGMARRYHWHSKNLSSFVEEPHTAICGHNKGHILNLTAKEADITRGSLLNMCKNGGPGLVKETRKIIMPRHHGVHKSDVNLKRLGAILYTAYEHQPENFEDLLMIRGLGPRTLQSLVLVSEVIHGTPSRFTDPARFSFAHGGKDGHPFPVPTKVYDQTISTVKQAVEKSKIGLKDKRNALRKLHTLSKNFEENITPHPEKFDNVMKTERQNAYQYGGRTVNGLSVPKHRQLQLF